MVIIGIDPGIAIAGYAVMSGTGNQMRVIDYGAMTTESGLPRGLRLRQLYDQMVAVITRHNPNELAIEELFFNRNVTTALTVGEARGVIILAAEQKGLTLAEYTPSEVKQAVAGYGKADKAQVQQMVKLLLGLKETPKPDDVADALAVAICHLQSRTVRGLMSRLKEV